ncbi:sensor histidine kinase [Lysinibacillus agricola]|uniref:Signal transduction histidine-protein kinase/phosphatase DegS n=1 Tax=Lysinibacillus agricola TaxID=2590012 RepID=A0ABX7ATD2_9BACI|nr:MULTISPECIES: sensor histidine kinase [Lysinibacillus]KOS60751.1 histidine kinase [Lysinibacillus sp. FJAT-14222]QQP13230.1 sensor histidine kinase [Lysinibacillus agricola]
MFSNDTFDLKSLDDIFNRMLDTIMSSKDDIFIISEQSRRNFEDMQNELEIVRKQVSIVIDEGDALEKSTQLAKQRLVLVSKAFDNYTEEQVREAYETAHDFQVKLSVIRTQEKQLRDKRDDLERRLRGLLDTIERADHIVNQVNVVLNYLTSDLRNVGLALEQAKMKQDFGIRIIAAQEEERKRLSREIHDGPAQMLANVLMRTDLIDRTYREKGIEYALAEIADLKKTVRNALSEVRRIIYDLRPMALDDLGIVPTLKKYLSTVTEYNPGVEVHFQSRSTEKRIPSNYEVSIFRLVQECVTNAMKHGNCKDIWVKLEWLNNAVNIVVKDDGKGFDPQVVKDHSFGILGMKERIEILDGTISITSEINRGTTVLFKIPLEVE